MNPTPETQKIRARIAQLSGSLRGAYNLAQQNRNNQSSLDRSVMEVVRLERQIRRSERALELVRAEERNTRAQKPAAALLYESAAADIVPQPTTSVPE